MMWSTSNLTVCFTIPTLNEPHIGISATFLLENESDQSFYAKDGWISNMRATYSQDFEEIERICRFEEI